MARSLRSRIACIAVSAIVGLFSSATGARAQVAPATPSEAAARSTAATASPELVNGLAKELGATPEQAASVAGLLFTITKALTKPEDFAAMSKAVPGMDALLAATPTNLAGMSSTPTPSMLTPGFASSGSSSTRMSAAPEGMAAAGISNLGFQPEMITKVFSFVWEFLKKYGGTALATIFEGLFKGAGTSGK